MYRATDAAGINSVLNHPEVHKWLALPGQDTLDIGPVLLDSRNILLMHGEPGEASGGILFKWQEPCVYEAHTMFLPDHRGRTVIRHSRAALEFMFLQTDAMEILTMVPDGNDGARGLGTILGFEHEFFRRESWTYHDGNVVGSNYYALRYPQWIKDNRNHKLADSGKWFHDRLEAASGEAPHPNDQAHDVRVGAAVEMIRNGQTDKAVLLYNRWARFAGYSPMTIIARTPLILSIESHYIIANSVDDFVAVKLGGKKCPSEQ